jgi:hypothetical protein
MIEAMSSSETSVLKRSTRRNNQEDGISYYRVFYLKYDVSEARFLLRIGSESTQINPIDRLEAQRLGELILSPYSGGMHPVEPNI